MSRRCDRVADLIKKEVSVIIRNDLRDPRIGFVTVSKVDVSKDLVNSNVYVSVMGSEKEKKDTLAGLISSSSFVRRQLAASVYLKSVPKLHFVLDKNQDHYERIQELLSQSGMGSVREGSHE